MLKKYLDAIANDPLNANLHLAYALYASSIGRPYLAYAELKTAEYLKADRQQVEQHATAFRAALPDQMDINHNRYFRLRSLSSEIIAQGYKSGQSILDIGGARGELAAFLPDDVTYCLVEPNINGISGTNLPFLNRSFDYVVSCHVLEHIPVEERTLFLDQLLSKARHGVIILNPFHVEGSHDNERLELIIDTTGAKWAKEHLGCSLPKLDFIRDYAKNRGLEYTVKPNGTMTTTMALVFVDYFAAKAGRQEEWKKLNAFYNEKFTDIIDSDEHPNAYIIYFSCLETEENLV